MSPRRAPGFEQAREISRIGYRSKRRRCDVQLRETSFQRRKPGSSLGLAWRRPECERSTCGHRNVWRCSRPDLTQQFAREHRRVYFADNNRHATQHEPIFTEPMEVDTNSSQRIECFIGERSGGRFRDDQRPYGTVAGRETTFDDAADRAMQVEYAQLA